MSAQSESDRVCLLSRLVSHCIRYLAKLALETSGRAAGAWLHAAHAATFDNVLAQGHRTLSSPPPRKPQSKGKNPHQCLVFGSIDSVTASSVAAAIDNSFKLPVPAGLDDAETLSTITDGVVKLPGSKERTGILVVRCCHRHFYSPYP